MRLHMLGLPHTRTTSLFSHCAFTGKVRRWAQMMQPLGYECIHYGVDAPDSPGWADHVQVMSAETQNLLAGYDIAEPGTNFVGRIADVGHPLYRVFNRILGEKLAQNVKPGDVICLPFGHGHLDAVRDKLHQCIETGIGYPEACCGYRIYESNAWMHWHIGRENRGPWDTEWIVPNYFDVAEWPLRPTPPNAGEFVLYLGRLTAIKGLFEIVEMAKALPDIKFVLCGQGDATPFLTQPNIEYHPPVHGMERAKLMHRAICLVMPTRYVEPFGGVAVEAMLTGTPCLTSNHSCFLDTVPEEWRSNTLSQWIANIRFCRVNGLPTSHFLRERAIDRYSFYECGEQYDRIFQSIPAIRSRGWYA